MDTSNILNESSIFPVWPEQEPVAHDYRTKYDRGCYKCRSQFCPGDCIDTTLYTTPSAAQPEQSRVFDPKQIEIEFFWPLTEQLKLDLDFTPCEKPKTYYYGVGAIGSLTYTPYTPNALLTTNFTNLTNTVELNLNLDRTNIVISGKPPLIRRWLYKLLGFKIKNGN